MWFRFVSFFQWQKILIIFLTLLVLSNFQSENDSICYMIMNLFKFSLGIFVIVYDIFNLSFGVYNPLFKFFDLDSRAFCLAFRFFACSRVYLWDNLWILYLRNSQFILESWCSLNVDLISLIYVLNFSTESLSSVRELLNFPTSSLFRYRRNM